MSLFYYNLLFKIALFGSLFSILNADDPQIVPFNAPLDLAAGSKVKLMCAISKGSHPLQFRWLRDGQALVQQDDNLFTQQLDDASILNIRQVQYQQNGNYTCVVSNKYGEIRHTASVFVPSPPTWLSQPPLNIQRKQGQPLRVPCAANGYPTPKIKWSKLSSSGSSLDWPNMIPSPEHSNGSIVIDSLTHEHEGTYECTADNGQGGKLKTIMHLRVQIPAFVEALDEFGKPIPNDSTGQRKGRKGEPFSLRCRAIGDPPLTLKWRRPGDRSVIPSQNGVEILTTHAQASVISEMHIRALQEVNIGEYECVASNELGTATRVQNIIALSVPNAPTSVKAQDIHGTGAKLTWVNPKDMHLPLQQLSVYYWQNHESSKTGNRKLHRAEVHSSSADWHVLSGLRAGVSYSAAVAAKNSMGEGAFSEPVRFTTKSLAPVGSPTDLQVHRRAHNEIVINWQFDLTLGGNVSAFQIYYKPASNANYYIERLELRNRDLSNPSTSHTTLKKFAMKLHNLKSNCEYQIKVRAYNREGYGPDSEEIHVQTLAGPAPEPPKITYHQVVHRAYLMLQWATSDEDEEGATKVLRNQPLKKSDDSDVLNSTNPVRFFMIYIQRSDDGVYSQMIPAGASQRQITITSLEYDVSYVVHVTATNAYGESLPSEPLIVKLQPYSLEISGIWAEKNMMAASAVMLGLFAIFLALVCSFIYMRTYTAAHRKKLQQLSTQTLSKCGTTKSNATYETISGDSMRGPPTGLSLSNNMIGPSGYPVSGAGFSGNHMIPYSTGSASTSEYGECSGTSSAVSKPFLGMAKSSQQSPQISSFGHVSIRSNNSAETPIPPIDFEAQLRLKEKLCQSNKSLNSMQNMRNYEDCLYDDALA